MNPKVSAYIATSLDGFIARADGELDWLNNDGESDGEDYGYQEFMDSVDVLIMGRNSFEKVLTFGEWPYGSKRVIVLGTSYPAIPAHLPDTVTALSVRPADLVDRLSAQGAKHLYVDGGITIRRFLAAGLIDEITITRIPILIGDGIPLFGPLEKDIKLVHIATRSFDSGYVQSKYRVAKRA